VKLSLEWHPRTRGELIAGLADALEALVRIDVREIRSHALPELYSSGVVYEPEDGSERWLGASMVYDRGAADCEDLAAWLAAQRRIEGDRTARAFPMIVGITPTGVMQIHIVVQSMRGIEDPSVVLGMGNYPRRMAVKPVLEGLRWSSRSYC